MYLEVVRETGRFYSNVRDIQVSHFDVEWFLQFTLRKIDLIYNGNSFWSET